MRFQAGRVEGVGQVSNISRVGLFVLANELPTPGEPISIWLEALHSSPIELDGSVRWTTAQLPPNRQTVRGFGVEIRETTPDFLEALADLMLH